MNYRLRFVYELLSCPRSDIQMKRSWDNIKLLIIFAFYVDFMRSRKE